MSEARFFVKNQYDSSRSDILSSGIPSILSSLGTKTGGADKSDLYAIKDFLQSRNAIEASGGVTELINLFSSKDVDFLSRLRPDASLDTALKYWRGKVDVYVNSSNGILVLRTYAFNPSDALNLSNVLIAAAEKLVNDMSAKRRAISFDRAKYELSRSANLLANARVEIFQLQQESGVIDPLQYAREMVSLLSNLELKKIDLEIELFTIDRSGVSSKSGASEIKGRLDAIDLQIENLNQKLMAPKEEGSISSIITKFERLKLDEEFALKLYELSQDTFEIERARAIEQQKYIVTVVAPNLPEKYSGPSALVNAFIFFTLTSILWGIAYLVSLALKDS